MRRASLVELIRSIVVDELLSRQFDAYVRGALREELARRDARRGARRITVSQTGKGAAQSANVAPLPPFPLTPEEVDHLLRGSASTSSGARIEIRGRIMRGMRGTIVVDRAGIARNSTVVIVEVPR